ncbi:hypothetical protein KUTeg_014990 [Tegillarca granosa]|uniref:START domain-containing protein n=1 Tax=Tegillarca granosa TaxID=220873 RepID=A0ABQ9ENT8_TEGGR|nr:hypothetical protein KUTeg_014990 [Tegillarca granosa]
MRHCRKATWCISDFNSSSFGSHGHIMDLQNNKKISTVRRTFCLLATFDLILTFILWVIYTQLIGETPVWKAFQEQVFNYTFEFSLFDTVITTSLTCAFLLAKCFLFKNQVKELFISARLYNGGFQNERRPLLSDSEQGRISRDDNDRYYSPEGSDEEVERSNYQSIVQSRSRQASRASINSLSSVRGIINMNAENIYRELVENLSEQPTWNPTVTECRTLQTVDENTDIVYNIAAEAVGGMVSARDFVNVRRWGIRDGIYMSSGCACTHPDMPPQKKYVRGENGAGGFIMFPLPEDPNKSVFIWVGYHKL